MLVGHRLPLHLRRITGSLSPCTPQLSFSPISPRMRRIMRVKPPAGELMISSTIPAFRPFNFAYMSSRIGAHRPGHHRVEFLLLRGPRASPAPRGPPLPHRLHHFLIRDKPRCRRTERSRSAERCPQQVGRGRGGSRSGRSDRRCLVERADRAGAPTGETGRVATWGRGAGDEAPGVCRNGTGSWPATDARVAVLTVRGTPSPRRVLLLLRGARQRTWSAAVRYTRSRGPARRP